MSRRLLAVLALTSALFSVLTAPASAANRLPRTTVPPAPPPAALAWAPCSPAPEQTFQCATISVPKDYLNPTGEQISLALTKIPAQDQANRIGSLLMNPGGPGGGGVGFVQAVAGDPGFATLNQRFDLVGFDPRGVAASTPPIVCLNSAEQDAGFANQVPFPTFDAVTGVIADAQAFAATCQARSGPILPFVSTESAARDLDQIRQAVGDTKLSYLGFSYGTYLGATYASLFPQNVRALVLDGALDPDEYANRPLETDLKQLGGFDKALHRFLSYCVTECVFGDGDPEAAYDALVARAQATPLTSQRDSRPVTGATVLNGTFTALYSRQSWPFLGRALTAASNGDGTLLQLAADSYAGRDDTGQYDNSAAAFNAISCADRAYPTDPKPYERFYARSLKISPRFGPTFWAAEYNCIAWQAKNSLRFTGPFTFKAPQGTPPVLVVGTTKDPATPYKGSIALVKQLGNAQLLTMRGDGHTAFGGNSNCIDFRVEAYLFAAKAIKTPICTQQATPPEFTNSAGGGYGRFVRVR